MSLTRPDMGAAVKLDDLQAHMIAALTADQQLAALLGADEPRIHDLVPARRKFPFVSVDELSAIDWSTDGENDLDLIATVRSWTRDTNRQPLYAIGDRIAAVFATLDQWPDVILCHPLSASYERDRAQNCFRATQRFRLLVEQPTH